MNYYSHNNQDGKTGIRLLRSALTSRRSFEERYEAIFTRSAARGLNKSQELTSLENRIGAKTNEIDSLISLIVRSSPNQSVRAEVLNILTEEIARKQRLAAKHKRDIADVKSGKFVFVGTGGRQTKNTKPVERYVAHLESRISTMMRWKSSII